MSKSGPIKSSVPQDPASRSSYVPHLDGLRAVALAGVLLYHFELGPARGGYTGVDVFFVLSGFLMTRNIRSRIEAGKFDLPQFYVSRFWRLYPSSLFTSVIALLAAYVVFPSELQIQTLRSALASSFLCSNVLFSTEIGDYFDAGAITKPLLHTWSLSLEEQFYFVWPLILVATTAALQHTDGTTSPRSDRTFTIALTALSAGSFVAAVLLSVPSAQPVFAWFNLPTRAYEFAAGALAYKLFDPLPNRPLAQSLLSVLGVGLIAASFVLLNRDSPDENGEGGVDNPVNFPGWASLPPCIGAVLTIITPRSFLSGEYALSHPFLRHIGKISYAAYLVHWPLWVFLVFLTDNRKSGLVVLLVTFVLAQLQYSLLENPCRDKSRGRVVGLSLMATTFIALAIGLLRQSGDNQTTVATARLVPETCDVGYGQPEDSFANMGRVSQPPPEVPAVMLKLNLEEAKWITERYKCTVGIHGVDPYKTMRTEPPGAVLIGDSFGRWGSALGEALDNGYALAIRQGGCFQYLGESKEGLAALRLRQDCYEENLCAKHLLTHLPRPTTIFLSFNWEWIACGREAPGNCPHYEKLFSWLPRLIGQGHRVIVVSSPPRATKDRMKWCPQRCLDQQRVLKSTVCPNWTPGYAYTTQWHKWVEQRVKKTEGLEFLDLARVYCDNDSREKCLAIYCGQALYKDDGGHLSPFGFRFMIPRLRKLLRHRPN